MTQLMRRRTFLRRALGSAGALGLVAGAIPASGGAGEPDRPVDGLRAGVAASLGDPSATNPDTRTA